VASISIISSSYPLHPLKETQTEAISEQAPLSIDAEPEPKPEPSTSTPVPEPSSTNADPSFSAIEPGIKKTKRRRKAKGPKKPENPPVPRDSLVSHAATSGTLILGHTSLLTACLLAKDEEKGSSYIITSDRDEHIRVSWYPQGHVIESYCLGSTQ
jgi:tRNA (guanine-N(7)-)-methyltransferase subunit TRM82